ncbi:leucine-rich repeats and immunoglobulin-like domains protein 1 [Lingula anatina]|uniref:Leucine-rich repeats and immunoglobulin-like domains protein 1 n=1 Tax=Lingula anatina TaxID=7574 RepID=A0A1S3JDJ7_LINAN|nr:leucine-rich repeats and immunoglobulin-like domains protein 1 [Lingula anatina]XP_013408347.1 leucine-rich repeats and immunoglobulin-like domains protein 1 [Lingula anatina]XP_013408354.1 leucine-rich repeats and immunoglobulin-like domains protein 1 [Lingula anatina]XP_013408359.1 leucine-rich repeats and immunoglobulin-like domains protein 1 [Lingula anatina]XP_013408366.1 leucine-rich repeats and immunoglobulin-like domains protein 1 [Lingula anatina]XP_013408374.1 leucine-rich repeats|eukprot:XP_013408341.1 leucine-rich repeats and immunoglobulin-like domains protein 1 [Lingula anatina]
MWLTVNRDRDMDVSSIGLTAARLCCYFTLMTLVTGQPWAVDGRKVPYKGEGGHGIEFLVTTNNVTAEVDEDVELICALRNLGPKVVIWKKEGILQPLTVGTFVFTDDERLSTACELKGQDTTCSLKINRVSVDDAGIYFCEVSTNLDVHLKYQIQLNVKERPLLPTKPVVLSGTEYVEKGSRMRLICNATGTEEPPTGIEWFKKGKRLQTNMKKGIEIKQYVYMKTLISILAIHQTDMEDAGDYICRSSHSSKAVNKISVHVLDVSTTNVKREPGAQPCDQTNADGTCSTGIHLQPPNNLGTSSRVDSTLTRTDNVKSGKMASTRLSYALYLCTLLLVSFHLNSRL